MAEIGFLTSCDYPELTPDDRLVVPLLQDLGIRVTPLVWDNGVIQWREYDAVIVRSCWDYHLKAAAFRRWLEDRKREDVRLINSHAVLSWNMDKSYLTELSGKGVAIVPTVPLARRSPAQLEFILREKGWARAVVKPAISATAYNTWTTSAEGAASDQGRFASLLQSGDIMVQQFMEGITREGEWSLVFLAGEFSHAVLKRPKSGDFRVQTDFGGTVDTATAAPGLIRTAQSILSLIPSPLLYARVDGVVWDGQFHLMELELVEPALYLGQSPGAPERFARAIHSSLRIS